MAKVIDLFDDISEFESLLADASAEAITPWVVEFVEGIEERYEIYGAATMLSRRQLEILEDLADRPIP